MSLISIPVMSMDTRLLTAKEKKAYAGKWSQSELDGKFIFYSHMGKNNLCPASALMGFE